VTDNGGTDTATRTVTVAPGNGSEWRTYRADVAHSGTTPAPGITHNVTREWRSLLDSEPMGTVNTNGTLYVGTAAGEVRAVDRRTGRLLWTADVGARARTPAVSAGAGRVLVTTSAGRLYALDADTGQLRWEYDTGDKRTAAPTATDSTVYVATRVNDYDDDGAVHAVDLHTGAGEWHKRFGDRPVHSPVTVGETRIYVATRRSDGSNGRVYALDRRTGSGRWSRTFGQQFNAAPALSGGTVYVGGTGGDLFALDGASGDTVWTQDVRKGLSVGVTVTDERVYVPNGSSVAALARENGTVQWRSRGLAATLTTPVTAAGNTLIVGADSGQRVFALDRFDGSTRWTHYTGRVRAAPLAGAGWVAYGAGSSVHLLTGGTGAPTAAFRATPTRPERGEPVRLNASRSFDPDGSVTSYEWDVDSDLAYELAGPTVTHAFETAGTHPIRLQVTDADGVSDTVQRRLRVPDRTAPTPALTANATVATVGQPVRFSTADSTDNLAITNTTWYVNGARQEETGRTLDRAFDSPGNYTVVVKHADPGNNTATAFTTVSRCLSWTAWVRT
jgi:outer membrane protein assembly factor BamB